MRSFRPRRLQTTVIIVTKCKWLRVSFIVASLLSTLPASAKCGSVDYSWGADALAVMHDYVVTMMLYVLYVIYAIAGIVVIYTSLQIYIKINAGDETFRKDCLMLLGAIFFLIGASYVFPAFFGYQT